ncbi:MAG: HigA family addiction module antitoxin [candidate division WOR-3 bacterium]|nr:HigA family addiction module antitoxin [candidate division WOR-3 bacterium]
MTKDSLKGYRPDWVAPPGDSIKENLEVLGMSQAELAKRMGMAKENINEILNGKSAITSETALKFENVLGMDADFILKLESSYRIHLAEEKAKEKQRKEIGLLSKIPYKEMVKRGWIEKAKSKLEYVHHLKQFLGVDSLEDVSEVYAFYRQSEAVSKNEYAVISWLRKGEIDAQNTDTASYDKKKLKKVIPLMRSMTDMEFDEVKSELADMLSRCGIAISYVPGLMKSPVYGVVKWLKPDKPFITMSLRYKTNDQFWFTLMHEIYHILYPKKNSIIVDYDDHEDDYEKRADKFAAKALIPNTEYRKFINAEDFSKQNVLDFAEKIDIAPGIIVGRLQHDGQISYRTELNKLKIKYEIEE